MAVLDKLFETDRSFKTDRSSKHKNLTQKGFTLIETIIAIVLMAIAMSTLTTMIYPYFQKSAEYQAQVRAASLVQTVMDTVLARSFDENSDHSGDQYRCGESNAEGVIENCSTTIAAEEPDIANFDDVDDYQGCYWTNSANDCSGSSTPVYELNDLLGTDVGETYTGFFVQIEIERTGEDVNNPIKNIEVNINYLGGTTSEPIELNALRGNY